MANDPNAAVPHTQNNGDSVPPPPSTSFKPDDKLKDAEIEFTPAHDADARTIVEKQASGAAKDAAEAAKDVGTNASQLVKDGVAKLNAHAGDRARGVVEEGKERAGTALDQLAQMLHEAAGNVDERIGSQYGDYARSAADQVRGFADRVRAKDPDELFDEARSLIRQSPGAAIGVAAALGFGIARLVQSGLEATPAERA